MTKEYKGYVVKEYNGCTLVIFTKTGIENGFNVRMKANNIKNRMECL